MKVWSLKRVLWRYGLMGAILLFNIFVANKNYQLGKFFWACFGYGSTGWCTAVLMNYLLDDLFGMPKMLAECEELLENLKTAVGITENMNGKKITVSVEEENAPVN